MCPILDLVTAEPQEEFRVAERLIDGLADAELQDLEDAGELPDEVEHRQAIILVDQPRR